MLLLPCQKIPARLSPAAGDELLLRNTISGPVESPDSVDSTIIPAPADDDVICKGAEGSIVPIPMLPLISFMFALDVNPYLK